MSGESPISLIRSLTIWPSCAKASQSTYLVARIGGGGTTGLSWGHLSHPRGTFERMVPQESVRKTQVRR